MKTCKLCDKEFIPARSDQMFCSHKCAMTWHNNKVRKSNMEERECELCGQIFKPVRGIQRFCSATCRDKANADKRRKLKCVHCGKEFMGYAGASYCGDVCRMIGMRNTREEKKRKKSQQGIANKERIAREKGLHYADLQKAETLRMVGMVSR